MQSTLGLVVVAELGWHCLHVGYGRDFNERGMAAEHMVSGVALLVTKVQQVGSIITFLKMV